MLALAFLCLVGAAAAADNSAAPLGYGCLVTNERVVSNSALSQAEAYLEDVPESFTVNVHFHIASTVADENLITAQIVDDQWEVLRSSFVAHDINLVLNSTTRVVDDLIGQNFLIYEGPDQGWVHYEEEQNAYFRSTRRGGYDELNIYFFSKYSPGATGYCHFPTTISPEIDDFGLDSCQLSAGTMPGFPIEEGGFESWNLGHLAVHEAGHWFGLNHTFAGGCSEPGDFVDDTPAQLTQVFGCPAESNTCPDRPGVDPIHNFMGYTDDEWYVRYLDMEHKYTDYAMFSTNEFTPGQKDRMFQTFFNYRRISP